MQTFVMYYFLAEWMPVIFTCVAVALTIAGIVRDHSGWSFKDGTISEYALKTKLVYAGAIVFIVLAACMQASVI